MTPKLRTLLVLVVLVVPLDQLTKSWVAASPLHTRVFR